MSNSPEPGREQWPAPWASPSPTGGTMTEGHSGTEGTPDADAETARTTPMPAAGPAEQHPGSSYQAPPAYPGDYQGPYQAPGQNPGQGPGQPPHSPIFTTPYGSPPPQQPPPVPDRRGPGSSGTAPGRAPAAVPGRQ